MIRAEVLRRACTTAGCRPCSTPTSSGTCTSPGTHDDDVLAGAGPRRSGVHRRGVAEVVATRPDPPRRILVRLAQHDRPRDVQEFVRGGAFTVDQLAVAGASRRRASRAPARRRPPHRARCPVPLRPDRLRLAHAVENLHWQDDDGTADGVLDLRLGLRRARSTSPRTTQRVSVVLRNDGTGEDLTFPSDEAGADVVPAPPSDVWCDYSPGRFGVRFPITEVLASGTARRRLDGVRLRVEVAGFTVDPPGHAADPQRIGRRRPRRRRSPTAAALIADWQVRPPGRAPGRPHRRPRRRGRR